VTRRDLFDFMRDEAGPWWGRLDEIGFLDHLYDLDSLPSTDRRHATAREDIGRHRIGNYDWDDDWVFFDPRFELADGPDRVLLDFLAYMAHPVVQPDTEKAMRLVARLNSLLSPDGWELRATEFISGRPVYTAVRTPGGPGRMIRVEIIDGDTGKLDLVLGQACQILGEGGHTLVQALMTAATLTLRADGGYYHPTPGDNWTEATSEAVLVVDSRLMAEFTDDVRDCVWQALSTVLVHHGRDDVVSLVIESATPPIPAPVAEWRVDVAQVLDLQGGNQARRERAEGGHPSEDELVFASRAELAVYQVLKDIQRGCPGQNTIALLPLPGTKLRDAGVRTPDFVVIGHGRAVVIEVDGPHHFGKTRKADDQTRDRHWDRCGVHTIRIPSEHTEDFVSLKELLQEYIRRRLWTS
jgi:AbiJ-like protein